MFLSIFFLILFFLRGRKSRKEISRNWASKLTWALRGSERSVLRILCCVSGEEAGTDALLMRKKHLPLSGF
jgi:hypothetical protein